MAEITPWLVPFLSLVVVVGGAGAMAIGRALAQSWQPIWRIAPAVFALSLAIVFLHIALLDVPYVSLAYVTVTFAILCGFSAMAYRATRAQQMAVQYSFLVDRAGLFFWCLRDPAPQSTHLQQ